MNIKLSPEEFELVCTAVASQKNSARKLEDKYLLSKYGNLMAKLNKMTAK